MSFDLNVMDLNKELTPSSWSEAFSRALLRVGAHFRDDAIRPEQGHFIPFYSATDIGGSAKLPGVDLDVCKVFYAIADETGCFLYADSTPLMHAPRHIVKFDPERMSTLVVEGPESLQQQLQAPFSAWLDFAQKALQ